MKVVLVCPYSFTIPGGVQNQVLGLVTALRRQGIDALALGPCDGEPPAPFVIPIGRSVPLASNGSIAPLAPDLPAMLRTISALRAERPDVVHLHEPFSPGPTWAALFGTRIPKVGTFHASGSTPGTLYRVLAPLARPAARRLSVRTAVSDDARQLVEPSLGGAYRILPNAVDVERFAKAEPWPRANGNGAEKPVILFVGRHEERKGLNVLLEAFRGLDALAELWVAGDGPQTEELQSWGVPGVTWLGRVSDDELCRRMQAATVFCAPSLHGESFGIVLLEAMAAGVPVVASDIPGYRDVARKDREGLLVPPNNPDALRAALCQILEDHALAQRLVEAGRERAGSFSMTSLAERYAAVYEEARARA